MSSLDKKEGLTNTKIGNLEIKLNTKGKYKGKPKDYVVSDTEIPKLKIRVTPAGGKIFYLFWKKNGNQIKYKIGKFGDIGLTAARKAAEQLLAKITLNKDPQAERKEERVVQKQEAGAILRAFLDNHYYPFADSHQKAPDRTRQILEYNFKGFMNNRMGSITKSDMDRWSKKKLAEGISPETINRASSAIVAVLNKAVEWEVIGLNPLSGRKNLKTDKRGVVRYLSEEEETRLLKVLEKESGQLPVLITLLLNTGARPKEAFSLSWDNINFNERRLTLKAAFIKSGQTRHIPINDKLLACLKAWKKESDNTFLFPGLDPTKPRVTVQKSWKRIKRDANLNNFRLYDVRHTFASKLVMRGIDLYTVSELLGHSSVEMTKIYAHLSPEHLKSAVDVL
jgi:integrase